MTPYFVRIVLMAAGVMILFFEFHGLHVLVAFILDKIGEKGLGMRLRV